MRKLFVSAALGLLLPVLPAQAHSASAELGSNGTTRFTFTVRGPAGSVAIVFASTRITNGLPLPPYGTLWLDPTTGLVNLLAIPIGPTGVGAVSLILPTPVVDGLVLATQAAIVSGTTVTLTDWAGIGVRTALAAAPEAAAVEYEKETQTLTVDAFGRPGAVVKVWEKEGTHVVLLRTTAIAADGDTTVVIQNVNLTAGDGIIVEIDGNDYEFDF